MESKRIFIAGPSGTGKSTLADWISKTYRIPFITTSSKPLWDKYQVKSHLELMSKCAKDPSMGLDFQFELLEFRRKVLVDVEEFVTDRSPVDNLVYFLMQNSHNTTTELTDTYIELCKEAMGIGNKFIFIPFNDKTQLSDDGMRIVNIHYQKYTSEVFESVLRTNMLKLNKYYQSEDIQYIDDWDWNTRMQLVVEFLREPDAITKLVKRIKNRFLYAN